MEELMQSAIDAVAGLVGKGLSYLLALVIEGSVLEECIPSLDYFNETFGGKLYILEEFAYTVGGCLIIAAIAFFAFRSILQALSPTKDTVVSFVWRLIISVIMMFMIHSFGDMIFEFGRDMLVEVTTYFAASTDDGAGKIYTDATVKDTIGEAIESGLDATIVADVVTGGAVIGLVLSVVRTLFYFIVAYNVIKLAVELIQRYVMSVLLYEFLPTACSFYATEEGERVFFTYVKMFGTEVGVVVLTHMWLNLSIYLLKTTTMNMLGMFTVIAFVHIGVGLERLLKDMGLSTTSMGGALLDGVAATGMIMMHAMSGLNRTTGAVLMNGAAITGNTKLGQVASGLAGRGWSKQAAVIGMENSLAGNLKRDAMLKNLGDVGQAIAENGTSFNRNAISMLNQKTPEQRVAATENMLDNLFGEAKEVFNGGMKLETSGQLNLTQGLPVSLKDANGTVLQEGFISDKPLMGRDSTSLAFEDALGNRQYLNFGTLNEVSPEQIHAHTSDEISSTSAGLTEFDAVIGNFDENYAFSKCAIAEAPLTDDYYVGEKLADGSRVVYANIPALDGNGKRITTKDENGMDVTQIAETREVGICFDGKYYPSANNKFNEWMKTDSSSSYSIEEKFKNVKLDDANKERLLFQMQWAQKGETISFQRQDKKGNKIGEPMNVKAMQRGAFCARGVYAADIKDIRRDSRTGSFDFKVGNKPQRMVPLEYVSNRKMLSEIKNTIVGPWVCVQPRERKK